MKRVRCAAVSNVQCRRPLRVRPASSGIGAFWGDIGGAYSRSAVSNVRDGGPGLKIAGATYGERIAALPSLTFGTEAPAGLPRSIGH